MLVQSVDYKICYNCSNNISYQAIPISIMSVITKQITIDETDTIIKIQRNPPSIQSNILWIQVLM